ncbi:MAG: ERF family protein, partial [Lutimonas sp.]
MFDGSPETDKVIPAFVKALAEMDDVTQNKKVEAGPMRYKYADLSAVLDATRPALRTHGLGLSQYPSDDGITTVIFHESGQYLEFPALNIEPMGRDPQKVGSAISYARRSSVLSSLGVATEDVDGRKA